MRGFHILDWIYTVNADIQISAISALKMFADSRYADIEKKCRYANIADADINIGTPLAKSLYNNSAGFIPQLMA